MNTDFDFAAAGTHLIEPIRSRARARPDAVALWLQKREATTAVTCREFMKGADRWSDALLRRGVGRGDVVLVFLDHDLDQYFSFFGALQIGAIPSFMPPLTAKQVPEAYWQSHATLLARIRPRAVIVSAARSESLRRHLDLGETMVIAPDDAAERLSGEPPLPDAGAGPARGDDIAFLQHSSGTTQTKKGVQLSHHAVLKQLAAYAGRLELRDGDCIASWLPLYHDMGLVACCVLPLVVGIPVIAIDAFEWTLRPELLLRAIERHRCTLVWMPNFAFHHTVRTCGELGPFQLGSVRAWIDCSEPCRPETFDLFARTFASSGVAPHQLQTCYAMAEAVFAVSQTRPGTPVGRLRVDEDRMRGEGMVAAPSGEARGIDLLSNGTALPGVAIDIVDPERRRLPEGRLGEIAIRAEFLFSGYRDLPRQTAERLVDRTYYTRDLGFLWKDEVYVLGRVDDLMIVNGRNFYAHEIEALVNQVPGLKPGRNVAFSVPDPGAGTDVCVVMAETEALDTQAGVALSRQIKQLVFSQTQLTVHAVRFIPPGSLLKTTSGKISRSGNRARYLEAPGEGGAR